MKRWERERILGEWGVRDGSARDQLQGRQIGEDADLDALAGRPLRRRIRNFRPDVDRYVASLGGPLPYMVRLRRIHTETAAHIENIEQRWLAVAAECTGDARLFTQRWRAVAEEWDFGEVNELIERHNRYYPIEARLPMDPKTGDFVHVAGEPYHRRLLDADWVLERFPPHLERAAA